MTSSTRMVRIATFENEPLARMWEQALHQEGIPCVARVLGPGPGGWGQAAALSYGLYVPTADASAARDLLGQSVGEEERADILESEEASWSPLGWAPVQRVLAILLLLVFIGGVVLSLYATIAR